MYCMAISIETDEKGKIHFPKKFGIRPREKLFVDKIDDIIVVKKSREAGNMKETGNQIAKILERNLKGIDFSGIEKDRVDREW